MNSFNLLIQTKKGKKALFRYVDDKPYDIKTMNLHTYQIHDTYTITANEFNWKMKNFLN